MEAPDRKSPLDYESGDEFRFRRGRADAPKQMSGIEVVMWLGIFAIAIAIGFAALCFLGLLWFPKFGSGF